MKAVILAAGIGKRMRPLTNKIPKALIKIRGKYLIQYDLEAVSEFVDEIIIVIGYKGYMIRECFGDEFNKTLIKYVEQKGQLGTGHALMSAEEQIGENEFIVMNGDDIYSREDIGNLIKEKPSVLVQKVEDPRPFGVWIEKNGFVSGFEEKSENPKSNLVNTGMYVLPPGIFQHLKTLEKTVRREYELNEAVNELAKEKPIRLVRIGGYWLPIGYPEHIKEAERFFGDNNG